MATNSWLGDAPAVARVETYTVGSATAAETFGVTINGKTVSYTAGSGETTSTVAAALQAALAASALPEFKRVTWSVVAAVVTGTAATPGVPFLGAAYGTGTLSRSVVTVGTGPNYPTNAANWSLGHTPAAGEDVVIDGGSDLLYELDLFNPTGVLASFTVRAGFTGAIGLPVQNGDGFREYLPRYLTFTGGVTAVTIGDGDGSGSGRMLLDFATNAPTIEVVDTGTRSETAVPALVMTRLGSGAVVNVADGGDVGIATETGQTATVTTLRLSGSGAKVALGAGATVGTVTQDDGTLTDYGAALTTVGVTGGTLAKHAGTLTTLTAEGTAKAVLRQGGTVATATFRGQGQGKSPTCDLSQDPRPITFTDHTFIGGAILNDPNHCLTMTNFGTWDGASVAASTFGNGQFPLKRT